MGRKQQTAHWITIASEGPWCTEALVGLRQYISLELDRVKQDWNGSQRPVNGSVNTANITFEFTVLETFSAGVCAYVWEYLLAIYTSAHAVCVYEGLLPHHSSRMDIRPAVKLDCLSFNGGLSLLRWKQGEQSGPRALLVEAHFEAFNVWQTVSKARWPTNSHTVYKTGVARPQQESHTPIKSEKQLLFILSESLYLAPSSYQVSTKTIDVVVV